MVSTEKKIVNDEKYSFYAFLAVACLALGKWHCPVQNVQCSNGHDECVFMYNSEMWIHK